MVELRGLLEFYSGGEEEGEEAKRVLRFSIFWA